jgi:hypothetical protein
MRQMIRMILEQPVLVPVPVPVPMPMPMPAVQRRKTPQQMRRVQ